MAAIRRPCARSFAEVGVLPRAHGSRPVHARGNAGPGALPRSAPRPGRTGDRQRWKASIASTSCCTTTSLRISVGEAGRFGSPGRREIGHGKLAWRAVSTRYCRPRRNSRTRCALSRKSLEIERSSSSMATVCGSFAGSDGCAVCPSPCPVSRYCHGPDQGRIAASLSCPTSWAMKDHLGDMDFKVAGTEKGITCAADGYQDHLDHGRRSCPGGTGRKRNEGRLHILGEMSKALTGAPTRGRRHGAAHHHHQCAEGEDPRNHRPPAARSFAKSSK